MHSPTREKRDHSRSRPPGHDDDADSLMDADGETDHESVASVYPIQNTAESSTSTANVSMHCFQQPHDLLIPALPQTTTRGSTETTVVTHTPPANKRQKPHSRGGFTSQLKGSVQKDMDSRSVSSFISRDPRQPHIDTTRTASSSSLLPRLPLVLLKTIPLLVPLLPSAHFYPRCLPQAPKPCRPGLAW